MVIGPSQNAQEFLTLGHLNWSAEVLKTHQVGEHVVSESRLIFLDHVDNSTTLAGLLCQPFRLLLCQEFIWKMQWSASRHVEVPKTELKGAGLNPESEEAKSHCGN